MISQADIQFLINPNSSVRQIHHYLTKNKINDVSVQQIADVQHLKKIIVDKTSLKKEILQILCYRAGEFEVAQLFPALAQQADKLNLLLHLADPGFDSYPESRKAEFVVYHQMLAALGIDKVTDLPVWLQLKILKAFKLQFGTLINKEFNHIDANAEGFDVKQLMRLAKDNHEGLPEKPATEKLALACWAATNNQDALAIYQEVNPQAKMHVAKGHRYANWFKAYEAYPQPLLNKIAKAYSAPQPGVNANLFAAALCYACVLRVDPTHAEAKESLLACFRQGDASLWADTQAIQKIKVIGDATSQQCGPKAMPQDPLVNDPSFFYDEKIPVGEATSAQANTMQQSMQKYLDEQKLEMKTAVKLFGIKPDFLRDVSLYSSRLHEPSLLQQAISAREFAWQKAYKKILAKDKPDLRKPLFIFRRQVTQQVNEFAALLNMLVAEAFARSDSLQAKQEVWVKQVDLQCQQNAQQADFKEIDACLWTGVSLIDEAQRLSIRLESLNPYEKNLPPDVSKAFTFIKNLCSINSMLLKAIKKIYDFYLEHLRSLLAAKDVLRKCLEFASRGTYSSEQETQLFEWVEGKEVKWYGKLFASREKNILSGTFVKFEETIVALAKLFDRAQAATQTQKDVLLKAIAKQSVFSAVADVENQLEEYEEIYLTFQQTQKFLIAEQQAKRECHNLQVHKRTDNATWQNTYQHILVEQMTNKLRNLIPSHELLWRALITAVKTDNGSTNCDTQYYSRSTVLTYLGFEKHKLPLVLSYADKLKAFAALEKEYTAYQALKAAIDADNIYYPSNADNHYVQVKKNICRINLAYQSPGYFVAKLKEYTNLYEAELAACNVMNGLIDKYQQELAYHNPRTLREGLNKLLATQTYAEAKEKFCEVVAGEKDVKRFLQMAHCLFKHDITALPGQFYIEKLKSLPKVAELLYQATQEISDEELQTELEKQQRAKIVFDSLKENYCYWFDNNSLIKFMTNALAEGKKDYVDVVAIINASILVDYNKLLGQLLRLKSNYHCTHRVTVYSAGRDQQIDNIVSYAEHISEAEDKQPFEKYVLILGKYKHTLDLVRQQHVKGNDEQHPNGAVKQFIKSHFTSSGLVTVMEQALTSMCPFIVAKAGFFGGVKTNFEHPFVTSAQQVYAASRSNSV